ncbi:MAG TPA: Ig-like domain-containing protein, partial [Gemmatimonadaceae bacterium]
MRPFRDTRLAALQSFAVALLLGGVGCSKDPAAPGASSIELIVVSPPAASVVVGGTLTLNAEVRDADGVVMQDARVSWASEDTTIASVSPDGVVTARNVGTVLIAASARGKDAFATVTVNP